MIDETELENVDFAVEYICERYSTIPGTGIPTETLRMLRLRELHYGLQGIYILCEKSSLMEIQILADIAMAAYMGITGKHPLNVSGDINPLATFEYETNTMEGCI